MVLAVGFAAGTGLFGDWALAHEVVQRLTTTRLHARPAMPIDGFGNDILGIDSSGNECLNIVVALLMEVTRYRIPTVLETKGGGVWPPATPLRNGVPPHAARWTVDLCPGFSGAESRWH